MLRLLPVLVLVATCKAPTAPLVALERRRAEFLFQTATFLSVTAGSAAFWWHSGHVLANGEVWEQEAMDLIVTAATEPLMRRLVFVPGELRFTFARLHSLFDDGTPAVTDCLANAFQATRFRVEDLPRLLIGLRIPETFVAGGHRFLGEEGLLILLVRLAKQKGTHTYIKRKAKRKGFSFRKRKGFSFLPDFRPKTKSVFVSLAQNESKTKAKRKQNESKTKAKQKQNKSKTEAKRKQNKSKTKAKQKQNENKTAQKGRS